MKAVAGGCGVKDSGWAGMGSPLVVSQRSSINVSKQMRSYYSLRHPAVSERRDPHLRFFLCSLGFEESGKALVGQNHTPIAVTVSLINLSTSLLEIGGVTGAATIPLIRQPQNAMKKSKPGP